jgi:hypothetical protein
MSPPTVTNEQSYIRSNSIPSLIEVEEVPTRRMGCGKKRREELGCDERKWGLANYHLPWLSSPRSKTEVRLDL